MKILIDGARGFVGTHFVKALSDHKLTLIDVKDGVDAGQFFRTNEEKFDLVIHLAATVGGRHTIDLAPHKLLNNFVLDSEMIQWAIKTRPHKIIYFSSSAAYPAALQSGETQYRLREADINLDDLKNPDPSIYGISKLTGEMLLSYSGLDNVYIFRPFSGYSETQSLDYPFPSFIKRAFNRESPFDIWGSSGGQTRDWIHIDDIVKMVLIAINGDPGIWNICNGRATNFNELQKIVCGIVGYDPEINYISTAPVGVQYRVGDPSKMNKIYVPEITLEKGIELALDKFNGYLYI